MSNFDFNNLELWGLILIANLEKVFGFSNLRLNNFSVYIESEYLINSFCGCNISAF